MEETGLLHPKSIYSDVKPNPKLDLQITIRTPDDLENLVRYIDYGYLRKKVLSKKTLFPPNEIKIKIPTIFTRRSIMEQSLLLVCCLDNFCDSLAKINPKLVNKTNSKFLDNIKSLCIKDIKNMNWKCEWKYKLSDGDTPFDFSPYLISDDCVYLIAMSKGNPERARLIKILLAQYCLAKKFGQNINKIGIIIPGNPSNIMLEDLSEWNSENTYWKILEDALVKKRLREDKYRASSFNHTIFKTQLHSYVGRHIFKDDLEYHITTNSERAYQFFLMARSYDIPNDTNYEIKIKNLITKNQANIFIHAPYVYDTSKPTPKLKSALTNLLEVAGRMGIKGVVIHVGKGAKDEKEAVENMKNTIIEIIRKTKTET